MDAVETHATGNGSIVGYGSPGEFNPRTASASSVIDITAAARTTVNMATVGQRAR